MEADDDTELALRAGKGDRTAFASLLSRHYDQIYRLAFRILGNRAEAEDLAQETCLALPRKIAGFRGEARFSTWLYRVTLNAARDQLRRKAAQTRAAGHWGSVEVLLREDAQQRQTENEWLTAALSRLSDDLRETVALVLGEELSHAAAGQVLGISEGTVSWRMSEVRKSLKRMAEQEARFG